MRARSEIPDPSHDYQQLLEPQTRSYLPNTRTPSGSCLDTKLTAVCPQNVDRWEGEEKGDGNKREEQNKKTRERKRRVRRKLKYGRR